MEKRKKFYRSVKMEITFFEDTDIVTSSNGATNSDAPDPGDLGDWGRV